MRSSSKIYAGDSFSEYIIAIILVMMTIKESDFSRSSQTWLTGWFYSLTLNIGSEQFQNINSNQKQEYIYVFMYEDREVSIE